MVTLAIIIPLVTMLITGVVVYTILKRRSMREEAAKRQAAGEEAIAMRKLGGDEDEEGDSASERSVDHAERDLEAGRERVPVPTLKITASP